MRAITGGGMGDGISNASGPAAERPEFRRAHLATLFLQASAPLTTGEIIDQVYNNPTNLELGKKELSLDSARKALRRDIDALKATGLIIVAAGKTDDGQNLWQVDRELSFAQGVALSEEDAVFLDIACLPLLSDPGFPERDELRLALAKIDRLFDAAATDALTASSLRDSPTLVAVREAMNERVALEITYVPAGGTERVRRVAPLAFFDLRSKLYVVCQMIDGENPVPRTYRTFRVDRIEDARRLDRISFEVPDDFDVNEFKILPFQIGKEPFTCTFLVPEETRGSIAAVARGKGELADGGDGSFLWSIEACDAGAAAVWAIAYGIRPLAPEAVVCAWRARLEEAQHG